LEEEFTARHGYAPVNVSYWDPGDPYRATIAPLLLDDSRSNLIDYIFSDDVQPLGAVVKALGFDPDRYESVITSNGTTAISLLMHYFGARANITIRFLGPVYFSAVHLARRLNIPHVIDPLIWDDGRFSLRQTLELHPLLNGSVLWITNPIYGTGVQLSQEDIDVIRNHAKDGVTVVFDEAYAIEEQRIGPSLCPPATMFGIYSPQKSINVNGLKFATLVTPLESATALHQLTDIVCGGLTPSNRAAIKHYLSPSYAALVAESHRFVQCAKLRLNALVPPYLRTISLNAAGPFITVNNPAVSAERGWDLSFLRRMADETGATFIPTCRNWMSADTGLGFRVNLCQSSEHFWQALGRLCDVLTSISGAAS